MISPYNRAEIAFDLKSEIGQEGKNSKTFIAHDHQLDANVVIKQIEKSKIDSVDLFFNESRLLYLSEHPNVVQIHYACQDNDHIYIAMPYYSQGSLNALMNKRFLTVREIIVFATQIANGLHNIHSKKLVHFDIKPDNILISNRGEALISDFGLAKHKNLNGRVGQDRVYSKMLPPECISTNEFTHAFDIYQFGLTLYRMCNGNIDFYSQFNKYGAKSNFKIDDFKFDIRNGRFPDRQSFLPHIPDRLRRTIKKCLETNPADRFQTTIDVVNSLADIDGNCLDWHYTKSATQSFWKKHSDGKDYCLTLEQDGSTTGVKSTASGNTTKIKEMCTKNATYKDIKGFLGGY